MKVCLVGESGAGKTTLINSVMNRGEKGGGVQSIADIFTADTTFAGKLLLFDSACLQFFYKMLGPWFSASSTIFILVVDLTRGEEELRRSSHYWVSFLKRSIFPSEKAHLVVIGSKLDRVGYSFGAAVLNSLVSYLQATFGYWFYVSYHHLDCRKTQNIEFERFKQTLRRLKLFALKVNSFTLGLITLHVLCYIGFQTKALFLFRLRKVFQQLSKKSERRFCRSCEIRVLPEVHRQTS